MCAGEGELMPVKPPFASLVLRGDDKLAQHQGGYPPTCQKASSPVGDPPGIYRVLTPIEKCYIIDVVAFAHIVGICPTRYRRLGK
jgi:hypothetical protein